jgi:hypothetical protein
MRTREHDINNIKKLLLTLVVIILFSYCINSAWAASPTKTSIEKPVFVPQQVSKATYDPVDLSSDIIKAITQLIGITPKEHSLKVTVDSKEVAIIPENSPLINMDIHSRCLKFGYGSDDWFICEDMVRIQEAVAQRDQSI